MFIGNLDVRHANPTNGTVKFVMVVHAYINDKVQVDLVSLGDLVLASEIYEENKGINYHRQKFNATVGKEHNYSLIHLNHKKEAINICPGTNVLELT